MKERTLLTSKQKEKPKASETELKSDGNGKGDSKADTGEIETSAVMEVAVDKELLQVCFWELFVPFHYFPISIIACLLHTLVIILMLVFKFETGFQVF